MSTKQRHRRERQTAAARRASGEVPAREWPRHGMDMSKYHNDGTRRPGAWTLALLNPQVSR